MTDVKVTLGDFLKQDAENSKRMLMASNTSGTKSPTWPSSTLPITAVLTTWRNVNFTSKGSTMKSNIFDDAICAKNAFRIDCPMLAKRFMAKYSSTELMVVCSSDPKIQDIMQEHINKCSEHLAV